MGHQLKRLSHCLNCSCPTEGNFCANCGQENEDQTASLKAVADDFLDDIIHFDSRLVRTAFPLIFKPGFLTNEYNSGKRVSYLSPYRMYLFVSAAFFLLLAYSSSLPSNSIVQYKPDDPATAAQTKAALASADVDRAKAAEQLKKAGLDPKLVTGSPTSYSFHLGPQGLKTAVNKTKNTSTSDDDDGFGVDDDSGPHSNLTLSHGTVFGHRIDLSHLPSTVDAYTKEQAALPVSKQDPAWQQNLSKNIILVKSDPNILWQKILDIVPKATFFLVPLYAASLYPMYLRRKRFYVEHLIYSLHTHAYVFVIFTLMLALSLPAIKDYRPLENISDIVTVILLFSIPVYLFVSLKKVYAQPWLKTFVKFSLAWTGYWIMLTFVFTGVLMYALLTS